MSFNFNSVDGITMDVLKEISTIGAGNAATALSKLIKRRISMKVPQVKILDFKDLGNVLGDPEKLVAAVCVQITGSISGMLLLIIDYEDALKIVEILTNKKYEQTELLDDIACFGNS